MNAYEIIGCMRDQEEKLALCGIDQETGEYLGEEAAANDRQRVYQAIVGLELKAEEKVEALAQMIEESKADAAAIAEMIKNLQKRKSSAENKAENLKAFVGTLMTETGLKRVKGKTHTIYYSSTKKLGIHDEALIPDAFRTTKTEEEIDTRGLLKALKYGGRVPGAHIIEDRQLNIRI